MDEQHFQDLLKQTLTEEIPTVKLWNQIKQQLPATPRQAIRHGFRLSKAPLLALLVIMTAAVAYALYQGGVLAGDPGISSLDASELLTRYDETLPIEGENNLSVTLDYAYADANRVTVGYTVRGESSDGQRMMAYSNPTLITGDGIVLERLLLGANEAEQEQATEESGAGFVNRSTVNFIAEDLTVGESLDLMLGVDVALSYLDTGEFPAPGMMMAGNVQFTFTVPFTPDVSVTLVNETVSVFDVDVELKQIVSTPSMTRLDMCYDLPDVTQPPAWSPSVSIRIADAYVFNGRTETYGSDVSYDLNADCRGVVIPQVLFGQTGEWTIEISDFQDLSFEHPDTVTGPWTFTIVVP